MLQLSHLYQSGTLIVSHSLNLACNLTIYKILSSQPTFEGETILWSTTGTPLQQRIDALPNVHISVGSIFTNVFGMRCRRWRCKCQQQHIYMRW
jgi:hypothetical protein